MSLSHERSSGIYLVAASAVLWSTAGLFVRMADMDVWSMVGWRSAFTFLALGAFLLLRNRFARQMSSTSCGWPGVAGCVVSAIAAMTYIASLRWTTVANVMTIYATLPFVVAGIAWMCMRDRVTYRFVISGCAAFVGVLISVGAAVSQQDMLGIFAAFVMTAGCATQIVIAKRFPDMDTTLMTALAALICLCVALPLMRFEIPAPTQIIACALYGVFTTALGYILLLEGSRRINAGEAGLISMMDVILGPVWVWLFYNEVISPIVLTGGAIVIMSVSWYLAGNRRAATVP